MAETQVTGNISFTGGSWGSSFAMGKMAERGLSETQIADLQARTELAREKAKAAAFGKNQTLEQQRAAITKAVDAAVDEWHRDIHAELKHDMDTIKHLAKVRKQTKVEA